MAAVYLANVPPAALATIPALAPPNGVRPNFANPPNRGPAVIAICSVLLALASLIYMARLYTRLRILRKPSWDDLTCGFGLIFAIINFAATVLVATKGSFGKHQWDVSVLQLLQRDVPISFFLSSLSWSFAQGFVKVTFFLMYLNIFYPMRWLRVTARAGAIVTGAFYLGFGIADIVLVTPKAGQTWVSHYLSPQERSDGRVNIALCAVGLAIDLFIFSLPTRAVLKLQLSRKKKIGLVAVFATGLSACVISAVSIGLRVTAGNSDDQTWTQILVQMFALLEILVGIIAACMPVMAPFFSHDRSPIRKYTTALSSRIRLMSMNLKRDGSTRSDSDHSHRGTAYQAEVGEVAMS